MCGDESCRNRRAREAGTETATAAPGTGSVAGNHPWLSLLRLPNLLTVPGDPLAGALLAAAAAAQPVSWAALWPVLGACLCLYAAGLLGNDYADRQEDARTRPERPIPSGAVRPKTVLAAALALALCAFGLALLSSMAALVTICALALAVWLYNGGTKHRPIAGVAVMGACRGLSLLAGSASQGSHALIMLPPLVAAGGLLLLVASITAVARRETDSEPKIGFRLALPPATVLATLAPLVLLRWDGGIPAPNPGVNGFVLLVSAMAVLWPAIWCGLLAGRPSPLMVQTSIGALIRGLILLQAALCASAGVEGRLAALGLLLAFMLSSWVGKWFSGS